MVSVIKLILLNNVNSKYSSAVVEFLSTQVTEKSQLFNLLSERKSNFHTVDVPHNLRVFPIDFIPLRRHENPSLSSRITAKKVNSKIP